MSNWALPSLLTVLVLLGYLAYTIARRPPRPMGPTVYFGLVAAALLAVGDLLTYFNLPEQVNWTAIAMLYTGLMFLPTAWWLLLHRFAVACGQPLPQSVTRFFYLPLVIAGLFWLIMMTNPWHGQFITVNPGARNDYHLFWWLHAGTGYAVLAATIGVYVLLLRRIPDKDGRRRIYFMIAAPIVNVAANLAYVLPAEPLPFDPTVFFLCISCVCILVGVYRIGFFSLSPLAMTTIIEQQPNGIIVTDPSASVLYWNSAAVQVLDQPLNTVHDNLYQWLSEHLHGPDGANLNPEELSATTANADPLVTDTLYQLKDKPDHWLSVRVAEIRSRSLQTIGLSFLLEDRTTQQLEVAERANLQRQMAESQKLESLGVLAGGIAHDFNNLLMSIRGNAELTIAQDNVKPALKQHIGTILEASDQAARLIKQLLDYAGSTHTEVRAINLSEIVRRTNELLRTAVLPHSLKLQSSLGENVWFEGDQAQIEQVLMNLTINAAESYAAGSGRVAINTGVANIDATYLAKCVHKPSIEPGIFAYVEVRDSGAGINAESVNRIFEPFYTTKRAGRGLGLAAVLGIVRNHGGALRVDSVPDRGTSIRAIFPMIQQPALIPPVSTEFCDQRSERVLVVDDEDAVRAVLCDMLAHAGLQVFSARGGKEAIELYRQQANNIDLVITDVAMPDMDGFETLAALRGINPQLPVIFMSGHPEEELGVRLREEHLVNFLMKPFSEAQLLERIQMISTETDR